MSPINNGRRDTSYALTFCEKRTLAEARSYTKTCGITIAEDKRNFSGKSSFELWWDATGLFNFSNVGEVTAHMEKYKKFYEEIDTFSAEVEKGDPRSYDRLLVIYKKLEDIESQAQSDVKNNQSKAVCRMLREFLDKKYKLDHHLKKVECIVLKQKMHKVEQTCESSKAAVNEMCRKMDELIEENRSVRKESDDKLSKLIEENRGIKEIIEVMRKEKEELALEAEKRSEAIRLESEEKLKHLLQEAEERSEARIREMKEESDKLRLEAERIRRESDEKLKLAVEEANKRSEARTQEMAEQNLANLQKMMKMLEAMNLP